MSAIRKRTIICIAVGLAVALTVVGIIALSNSNAAPSPAELLSLGEKYLSELDYEQALVQFLKVIEIEPMNERAYLGVQYLAVTAEVAKEYDLPVKKGAYIYSGGSSSAVIAEGPADKAGIKDQDILISINGVEVGTRGSILSLVGEYMPGETVKMGILRNGHQTTLEVTLGAYPTN